MQSNLRLVSPPFPFRKLFHQLERLRALLSFELMTFFMNFHVALVEIFSLNIIRQVKLSVLDVQRIKRREFHTQWLRLGKNPREG